MIDCFEKILPSLLSSRFLLSIQTTRRSCCRCWIVLYLGSTLVPRLTACMYLQVIECKRDEDNKPFDDDIARKYASELYAAGGARVLGCDNEVFIKILVNINHVQFESINKQYNANALLKDIQKKLGGSFGDAVAARCQEKYAYLVCSRAFSFVDCSAV